MSTKESPEEAAKRKGKLVGRKEGSEKETTD